MANQQAAVLKGKHPRQHRRVLFCELVHLGVRVPANRVAVLVLDSIPRGHRINAAAGADFPAAGTGSLSPR